LHHGPTRGGRAEDDRFLEAYEATRASYQRCFGTPPPADLWPEPSVRFAPQARWQRIDRASYWCLPKNTLRRTGLGLLGMLGLSGAAVGCSMAHGEALIGNGLVIMTVTLAVTAGLGWLIVRTARGGGSTSKRSSDGCGSSHVGGGCSTDSAGGHHGHADGSSGCGSSGCGSSGCGSGGCGGS
jgi:hypothetical protein